MKIKNKVFVVTGGGSGVGRELVLELLKRGAKAAAVDIQPEALEETFRLSGGDRLSLSTHVVNVADSASVQALPCHVLAHHGAVDGIINCAGIVHPFCGVDTICDNDIERVLCVNFFGTLSVTKAFLPYLSERPQAYITNISSAGALSPAPGETVYGASKAAVKILTEGLRSELGKSNIRVMVVFPGGITSNILDNSGVVTSPRVEHLRKKLSFLLLSPQKAAGIIIRGIARNRLRLTPGIDAVLMDISSRLFPSLGPRLIHRLIQSILRL